MADSGVASELRRLSLEPERSIRLKACPAPAFELCHRSRFGRRRLARINEPDPGDIQVFLMPLRHAYRMTAVLFAIVLGVGCDSSAPLDFTLDGTISGLTSDGLVLANGGVSLDVANGATSFSLGAVWPPDSSYSVTVQAQPFGQTCTVANGSGTAGGAVADITVSCVLSTMSFTTPGSTTWVVPAGESAIDVVATGAGGGAGDIGDAFRGAGGNGGIVTATLAVSPGDVLNLVVGGGGASLGPAGSVFTVATNGFTAGGTAGGDGSLVISFS